MSRVLPIQPPLDFKPQNWTKFQQDDLRRMWQDIAAFINQGGAGATGGGMLSVLDFPGADAGQKIANVINALPTTGGIVDARALAGSQNISQNVFQNLSGKPITILFGAAQFHVTVPQVISLANNIGLQGTGCSGDTGTTDLTQTTFLWDGANGGTVFTYDRARDCAAERFNIVPGTGTIGIGIRLDHISAGSVITTHNTFRKIAIGISTTAVQIGNSSVANNDLHVFEDVFIGGAGTQGYFINNGQSKNISITGGSIGFRTHGVMLNNGSFTAENINLSNNTNDFSVANVADTVLIRSCHSESANKFLNNTSGATLASQMIILLANRGATNNVGADNVYLFYQGPGPLVLIGNQFYTGGNQPSVKVLIASSITGQVRVASWGNLYWDTGLFTNNSFVNRTDLFSVADMAVDGSSQVIQMPPIYGFSYNGTLTLANGANDNIAIPAADILKITGPTAAFSISGFLNQIPGRRVQVFNSTSQQMTIKNQTGSSTYNQIQTLTGADVVLRAGTSYASFYYDPAGKWILTSSN